MNNNDNELTPNQIRVLNTVRTIRAVATDLADMCATFRRLSRRTNEGQLQILDEILSELIGLRDLVALPREKP